MQEEVKYTVRPIIPLGVGHVGKAAKASPLVTAPILAWTMNFSAAAEPEMSPEYYDTSKGNSTKVHPYF